MVKKEEIEAFKNELRNIPYYENKFKEIEEEIKVLEYEMEGVKGVDYSKQRGTANPAASETRKLILIEKKEKLLKEKNKCWVRINDVLVVLNKMDCLDRDIVERIYKKKKSYRELCDEMKIKSTSSLQNAVDKAILNALKKAR